MRPELYWVPTSLAGRLAILPRPRGDDWLEDEVRGWRRAGIDVVVSLLTPDEATEFGLTGEAEAALAVGIEFLGLPTPDRGVPDRTTFEALVGRLVADVENGRTVAVHCRQGIGRSGLVAAGVLIAAGLDPEAALRRVSEARDRPVPETAEQRDWLLADRGQTFAPARIGERP
jgi:protein-tyrosine phosphatase